MVCFGQLVVGPPACGKTTYCNGVSQFMEQMGRQVAIVNLDFANEMTREGMYDCAVDVRDLVSLERVMDEFELGPNGGIMYCMEYLHEHTDWLVDKLAALESHYIIFDCPGQVELFTHHTAMQDIVAALQKQLDFRLCSVHLVDSFYCVEPSTFISATLGVASSMLRLGLPHVNVLTKVDLLPMYGQLPFTLDFFTDLHDLTPLVRYIDGAKVASEGELNRERVDYDSDSGSDGYGDCCDDDDSDGGGSAGCPGSAQKQSQQKQQKPSQLARMAGELTSVLSDFGLLGFLPMNVQDATTVGRVLIAVDRANGYTFAADEALEMRKRQEENKSGSGTPGQQERLRHLFNVASQDLESTYERSLEIFEKYSDKFEAQQDKVAAQAQAQEQAQETAAASAKVTELA